MDLLNGPYILLLWVIRSREKSRSKEEEERLRFWVKYFCRGQLVYGLTGTSISTHTQVNQVFSMILMAPLMQMVSTGAHTHQPSQHTHNTRLTLHTPSLSDWVLRLREREKNQRVKMGFIGNLIWTIGHGKTLASKFCGNWSFQH